MAFSQNKILFFLCCTGILQGCGPFTWDSSSPSGGYAHGTLLVGVEDVVDHRGLIIDIRPDGDYKSGHLPGAINLPAQAWPERITPEILPQLEAIASQYGLLSDDDILIVGEDLTGWGSDGRLFWILEFMGHGGPIALLNGGYPHWVASGYTLELQEHQRAQSDYRAQMNADVYAGTLDIENRSTASQLIDTRSLAEYDYDHIPGALWYEWSQSLNQDGTIRHGDDIRLALEKQGIALDKETYSYCQTGYRSAHFYFIGRLLGISPLRNYDGSWDLWSQSH